jgi:hypothetical protein
MCVVDPRIWTYAFIVAFPSLLKIRKSDCIETLEETTSGFFVVPSMYSDALCGSVQCLLYLSTISGTHIWLSKVEELPSNATLPCLLAGSAVGGTMVGKDVCCTPPIV